MSQNTNHTHEHGTNTKEETLALLKYMADHNSHHARELHEFAHGVNGEAGELIHEAVKSLEESTVLLQKAINLLEEK